MNKKENININRRKSIVYEDKELCNNNLNDSILINNNDSISHSANNTFEYINELEINLLEINSDITDKSV